MASEKKQLIEKRSGQDRRKIHTYLAKDRRIGPYCRRRAGIGLKK